uniref:ARM repeat superfamily protein n=1 Tax=Kalanchoe fedtschenkoi TaxID=63787 RepID=A0A7N0VAX5_KALFE
MRIVTLLDSLQERMVDVGSLSTLVKSLGREAGEGREAAGLLLALSDSPAARRRIGRVQGCVIILVSMLNGDDHAASCYSSSLLDALSGDTQNALHMAEAGHFKPLVQHLRDGSDMSKILMASALSRIKLTDQNRAALGQEGAVEPLADMFNTGKMEAKLSALNALHALSGLPENVQRLISSGIVLPLLQLLFSVTSALMTLREPAAAILARIAQSESILVNKDVAQQMLSLLGPSSPSIKYHLLHALDSICTHPGASRVRKKITERGAFQLLLPFLSEPNNSIRVAAVNLLYTLSKYFPAELSEQFGETYLVKLVSIVASSVSEEEKAAGVGILSNLPISDKRVTDALLTANVLHIVIPMLDSTVASSTPMKRWLSENISRLLIRFTVPSDKKLQRTCAQHEVIPLLVKLLSSESSSIITKSRAATSLTQLSENSLSLRKPRKWRWACVPPSAESFCDVHDGFCHVKTTYCLVKAKAVAPLIQVLVGEEREADEAVLSAISTLLVDEICENGCNCLAEVSGIQAVVEALESGTVKVQEKCLWILERVFRSEDHRKKYGEGAERVLIDLAQKGDVSLKPAVGKILAQLELVQMQSSYF